MTALTVYQGLEQCFRTVEGLRNVILGEPTAAHDLPCLYTAYESFTRPLRNNPPASNLTGMDHVFTHRLMIRWQDNAQAELELLTLLDLIPDAVDRDPHLSGRLTKGIAYISRGSAGFVTIGGVMYRVVDYEGHVLEKRQGT